MRKYSDDFPHCRLVPQFHFTIRLSRLDQFFTFHNAFVGDFITQLMCRYVASKISKKQDSLYFSLSPKNLSHPSYFREPLVRKLTPFIFRAALVRAKIKGARKFKGIRYRLICLKLISKHSSTVSSYFSFYKCLE